MISSVLSINNDMITHVMSQYRDEDTLLPVCKEISILGHKGTICLDYVNMASKGKLNIHM